ncbi:MAG TPA: DNA-binding response regulator [Coriobacteriia bacterium]|nr:DNA-binding response regulator [Coriobacteriia bacterium]
MVGSPPENSNDRYTVLVCDDDEDILSVLEIYLKQEGYRVIRRSNGLEAVEAVAAQTVHLAVLDIMMPVMDGIQTTVNIRETSNVPILFLSAKSEDTDRILGLNMGGDDYITKPFNPVELLARVRAALRRYARLGGLTDVPTPTGATVKTGDGQSADTSREGVYQTGDLELDDTSKSVRIAGVDAGLTAREYNILKLLMANMDRVFSSAQIYEAVWEEPAFNVSKTVSVHIRHIREKIEISPKEPRYLKVIYGLGYKVVKLK